MLVTDLKGSNELRRKAKDPLARRPTAAVSALKSRDLWPRTYILGPGQRMVMQVKAAPL